MGLRLILGRAGTGKTRTCLTEIRQALAESPLVGSSLILLVPEQATFQMEQALVAAVETGVVIRAQVYSFRRLAWQVLQEVGGSARLPIGELGKRMVLRQLLENHRPELRVFHRAAGQPGFADTLAGILAELKLYNVATADLALAASRLTAGPDPGLLGDKLHDLELLYQALSEFLAGRYTDPDDYLALLAERLLASTLLAGAVVWVDGFAGFTPQELRVLGALLTVTDQVNVTLCLAPEALAGPPEPGDPFYRTRDTYDRLCRLAREKQAVWEPAVVLPGPGPRFVAPVLSYLEAAFFARPYPPFSGPLTGLGVYAGVNRRSEVEGVAREIIRLCRDQGYRWREIAVFLRDLEPYDDLITTVFADFGIPFFMDRKRPVRHHPLVELIRSALEAVRRDWAYEPVFRYLKTDLVPVDREAVDRLENYVLAHGIRGSRWRDDQPWVYRRRLNLERGGDKALTGEEAAELVAVNTARDQARVHLAAFHQAVKGAGDVRQLTTALYQLLLDLGVSGRIAAWSREAEAAGEIETARAHRQVWTGVVDLLDQLVAALGPVPVDLANYAVVVEAGLESLHLGLIPPELDQVLVGSLDRSRSPAIRAAFIPGVTDGVFPARLRDDGVFDDAERERLREVAGLELAPGARRRLLDEVYLVYLALTRAGERCYVSYPLADPEGRALTPSPVIARLRELFPRLTVAPGVALAQEEYDSPPLRCLSDLVPQLRAAVTGQPVDPVWWAVYSWFAGQDGWRDRLRVALAGLWHRNQEPGLPGPVSRLLYGQPLKAGITRLERFQACPFAHFATYGLRLEPRPVFQLGAPDLGQFFHAALQRFGEALYRGGLDWGELTPGQCRELTGQVVAELAPRLQSEILLSSARYRYLTGRLQQTVAQAVTVLGEHARRGRFRPLGL
ncbi:MAG: PD-(D/E)XK nuclease family protein, partial [Heliobacteriaceae bacterium]|nr:PD-(D/E)XK nuclease family protein [Heliobacteriaceae bacterium]